MEFPVVDDNRTALKRHVDFFDRDGDDIIWPSDTYIGFRALGFGLILSVISTIVINGAFSWFTYGTLLPDPCFRMRVSNMHRAKHGSDSESYTTRGDFDETRFNYVFDLNSPPPHTYLTFMDGVRMVYGNRNPYDFFGWFAAAFEWGATYLLLWPADGRVKKEDVRGVFDGSIFWAIAGKKHA